MCPVLAGDRGLENQAGKLGAVAYTSNSALGSLNQAANSRQAYFEGKQ